MKPGMPLLYLFITAISLEISAKRCNMNFPKPLTVSLQTCKNSTGTFEKLLMDRFNISPNGITNSTIRYEKAVDLGQAIMETFGAIRCFAIVSSEIIIPKYIHYINMMEFAIYEIRIQPQVCILQDLTVDCNRINTDSPFQLITILHQQNDLLQTLEDTIEGTTKEP